MRLVLAGAGHAHLFVLEALAQRPIDGLETTLITPQPRAHYSGMIPGFLAGTYAEEQLSFDVAALARAAGARLVLAKAERVDGARRVVLAGEEEHPFDVASIDVGSIPAGLDVPGVREHATPVRPLLRAIELVSLVDANRDQPLTVVGGGAAGVEVSLALARRRRDRGLLPRVTLVDRDADLLRGFSSRVVRLARNALQRARIEVVCGRSVVRVDEHAAHLDDGARLEGRALWLAGAAAPELLSRSTLPLRSGFFAVDSTLRAADGAAVFGAGDCISLQDHPSLAKAGVFAVREGPVLAENLRAALLKKNPQTYRPQRNWLALLNTADGQAILRWHAVVAHSPLAWRLKDRIDRKFVARFSPRAKAAVPAR